MARSWLSHPSLVYLPPTISQIIDPSQPDLIYFRLLYFHLSSLLSRRQRPTANCNCLSDGVVLLLCAGHSHSIHKSHHSSGLILTDYNQPYGFPSFFCISFSFFFSSPIVAVAGRSDAAFPAWRGRGLFSSSLASTLSADKKSHNKTAQIWYCWYPGSKPAFVFRLLVKDGNKHPSILSPAVQKPQTCVEERPLP